MDAHERQPVVTQPIVCFVSFSLVPVVVVVVVVVAALVPTVRSIICPDGEGEVVVKIKADSKSDEDFNYWSLYKVTGAPPATEVASETMSTPNEHYEDAVCVETGSYMFGLYDFHGDGLCFQGRCPRSATEGTLSVRVDGIEVITDQPFDLSLEVYFDYPLCDDGQGVFIVNIRTDDESYDDFNWWGLNKKTGRFPPYSEIASDTLSVPNSNYHTIVCIDNGEYYFGLYDCDGDGLCYNGECGGSQGTVSVSIDGAEIVPDQDWDAFYSLEEFFDYPYECVDEYGPHDAVRPSSGNIVEFTCLMLTDECDTLPINRCKIYCDAPLDSGGFVRDVCKATCGEVGRGRCR